jgi:hypothetical protein
VGVDMDPLAVLLSRAWTSPVRPQRLLHDADLVVKRATQLSRAEVDQPWQCDETTSFAAYWFARPQYEALLRLSSVLRRSRLRSVPLLWVCFSRLIITKDRGASLARDVSHSRPHRVSTANDFDVMDQFGRSARVVAARLSEHEIHGCAEVAEGDARRMGSLKLGQFDAVITSPPYLNAIDYLRGHRLALIWLGHEVGPLRQIRADQVGAERAADDAPIGLDNFIMTDDSSRFGNRYRGWVNRYATDMAAILRSIGDVTKRGGTVVLVVGNSMIRGASIDNAGIVVECAKAAGLELTAMTTRSIPARRRYLPTPVNGSALAMRMRAETVLTFTVDRRP